jgi:ribosomal peptide maturation radical SAM protein 1
MSEPACEIAVSAAATAPVLLIHPPFGAIERPSLALGLLRAELDRAGIASTVVYANLDFAAEMGAVEYGFWEEVLGEVAFGRAAFPEWEPDWTSWVRGLPTRPRRRVAGRTLPASGDELVAAARAVREKAASFVDRCAREVVASGASVVGCSSTFVQHTASLALLRRVRELAPATITLLGGAACETVMGRATHRSFPWVDFVVSGEADDLIAKLCRVLLEKGRSAAADDLPFGVLGPVHREVGYPSAPSGDGVPRAVCSDLAALPTPHFDDYFTALAASPLRRTVRPGLAVETARGCWYGAVRQCTFCGIGPEAMAYHSKPAARVRAELDELASRHRLASFSVADNILDLAYFEDLLPDLAAREEDRRFFWETKANLRRSQVELLRRAGVVWLQPGIESLDSRVLGLMQKGVRAYQNVQLLRWCRELGVRLSWNLLWDLPGEADAWYAETAARIPLLYHLQPPRGLIQLRYDRYSVYQARAAELGLELEPAAPAAFAFPLEGEQLSALSYHFARRRDRDTEPPRSGVVALHAAVRRWQRRFWSTAPPVLAMEDDGTALDVLDTRASAVATRTRLEGLEREVALACDGAPPADRLPAAVAQRLGVEVDASECVRAVASLERRGLLLPLDGRLLWLPVRGSLPRLPALEEFPGGHPYAG